MRAFTRILTCASAAALVAAAALAQAPADSKVESRSKVERKGLAPVSKEILKVKLPKPVKAKLANGLTVLVLEDHRFPTVTVQLTIQGAGPVFEPADQPGLANITAQMLREGTKTLSSRQLSEKIDTLGATLNANSQFGSVAANINASGLSDNFDQWFSLVADVLMNPAFNADELAKLKQRLKVQLRQQRSQPGFLANERFSQVVYGTHPASVVTATEKSVDAITPEAMTRWHATHYGPQNAILGIAGDVDAAKTVEKLKVWLKDWKKNDDAAKLPPNPTPVAAKKVYIIDRPNSVQTTFSMGNVGIDRRSPDYIPFTVLNSVLGGGAGARLFLNLREDKGYTYGVYSNFVAVKFPGPWRMFGDVRTDVTAGAMTEFMNELKRIRDEAVPTAELDERKHAEVAAFALSLEQPTDLIGYAITREIYGLPDDYWETYPARLMAVTSADVQRVARKYMDPETMQIVAVGDASKIRSILEKYGPMAVYDTEGKAVMAAPQ